MASVVLMAEDAHTLPPFALLEDEVELYGLKAGASFNGKKGQVQGVTMDASGDLTAA